MVQKKEKVKKRWDLPSVRIESRELLSILEEFQEKEETSISAETSEHIFESLEDIKKNIEVFQGEVKVEIGSVKLDLSEGFLRGIRVIRYGHKTQPENPEVVAEKLYHRLLQYRVFLTYAIKTNGVALTISLLGLFLFGNKLIEEMFETPNFYLNFYLSMAIFVLVFVSTLTLSQRKLLLRLPQFLSR